MDVAYLQAAIDSVCINKGGGTCGVAGGFGRLRGGRVCSDSRQVGSGDIFVAVRGVNVDGHDFIVEAIKRGATVVVAERPVEVPEGVRLVQVADSAQALGRLAQAAWGEPSAKLKVLGVTGTNGKTTVSYLTRAMLQAGRLGCGLIGTVEYDAGDGVLIKADNTTPGPLRLAELMGRMQANALRAMVMECSSHGLDQKRTAGINFAAAAFTNLSGDHLDYHQTEQEYLKAKSKLFADLRAQAVAVLNAQDKAGDYLAQVCAARIWWYGIDSEAQISGHVLAKGLWGCEFELRIFDERVRVRTSLIGEHNVNNALAAAGLAWAAGVSIEAIAEGVKNLTGVPGRLERISVENVERGAKSVERKEEQKDGQVAVFVDYAHTDDALDHALATVRDMSRGEVIVVFGCGGNRDQTKRPRMAKVAQRWADYIVVTNDNPRKENPAEIIAQIRTGFTPAGRAKVTEIPDRREAIAYAISQGSVGDVVLIAGKGHEDYQIVGEQKRYFDDREVVREIMNNKLKG